MTNEWRLKAFMPFDMFDLPKLRLRYVKMLAGKMRLCRFSV